MSVVLLVDTSELPAGITPPTRDLRGSLSTFVKTIQAYDSNVKIAFIEVAGAAVPKVDFTAKAADLDAVINRLYQGQQQQAVMLEALVDASKRLAEQPPPRRAIVALDFNSREGSAERTMKDAAEAVHKAGATLWTVSVRGAVLASPNREETFNKISQANGGLRLMPIDAAGLEPNLKIVAHSLASQYTVTFVRPDGGNPKTTKFETKRGTKVQLTPWMR
jgi:hypothetical protein